MKKTKKVLFIGILIAIMGIFLLASENIVDIQKDNYASRYAQAYNHKYENILDNVFEENGLTILPFIFENSDQTITKVYLLEQFEKAGLKVENGAELGDIIVTGDEIKTADKTYTVLIYGDVNRDGYADVFDADEVFRHDLYGRDYTLSGIYKIAGNVYNDDAATDVFDAQQIFEFDLKLITKLVLNEPEASKKPDIPDVPEPGDYVTGITATTEKTEYEFGEGIDASKIVVKETLSSGKVGKTLTDSQYKISEYDPYEEGEQAVKVTYTTKNTEDSTEKTFETTFKVTVKPYVPDPKAPVITLKGDKEVTVKIGQYKELGATAVDFEGKEIDEKEIVIDASQIKDEQGVYKVIYKVKDKNTKKEAIAVRTVVVIDYVTGITATTEKPEYAYGEPLDKTKIVVKETMASKVEGALIALEKLEITGYEPNKVGEQEVTITYKTNNTIDDKEETFTASLKLTVKNPEIKVNDGEKDITQITLYTEMPENIEMVKEDTLNGNIYTLIPISLAGYEPIPVTREDIVLEKQDGKISIIDTKLDTSITESAILIKTYKKAQDGTFEEIDENSIDQTIDYIGIAINKNVITKSEDLENIKIYYGNSKDASVTLEVNPKVDTILVDIEDNTEVTLNQPKDIQVTFKNAKGEEIDIPARRVTLNSTEMEFKLLDKDKNEIDVTKKPEAYVKYISVKPEVAGENKTFTIIIDKDDSTRKVEKDVKLKVTPPSIESKDEQGNNITDIILYTKKPLENNMVKEYTKNGKTNIYTLIPISYKGKEGSLLLTLEDIVLEKQEGKISVIGTNIDTSITENAILIKKYKKAEQNGTFNEVDENSIDKTVDYIGIAINKDIITKPEDLKDVKIYYGNSTESSLTLPINPKVEEIIVNESNPVEITANQEIDLPVIFKINGKEVEIPVRRILAEATGIEVKLKDKDKVEIDVAGNPEEPVKFISVKAEEIGEDQPITITLDKNDTIREETKQQLIQVLPPTIVAKDIQGNSIKEVTLYTKKPTNNGTSEDRFEQSSDGKILKHIITEENTDNEMVTHIYTLIPIELKGTNGNVKITSSEVLGTTNKLSLKSLNILDNITDKAPETSTKYSSFLFKTYKKAENGSYIVLDDNDSIEAVDCIGISIDDTMVDTPEELEYIKFVYGTSKITGTTLTINPKVEEIEINNLNPVEVTVNQEISIPVTFKNAKDEEIDIPARRVIAEFKGINLQLKDKDGVEINLAERPEEPVKFIVIKATIVEKNQILTITVDKDNNREKSQSKLVNVVSPEIEIKDKQGNNITEIALYPKMEVVGGTNEDRFEETSDGNTVKHIITEENNDGEMVTHIYTLVPIKLKGINGDIDITSAEIISNTNKLVANYLTILEDRTDNTPETSTKYSSILFKAYKKVGDIYQPLDENDSIEIVEYIGISIDDTMVDSPEELQYIKFVYGTDKEHGKKLTITKPEQGSTGDAGSTDNTGNTIGTGTTDNP